MSSATANLVQNTKKLRLTGFSGASLAQFLVKTSRDLKRTLCVVVEDAGSAQKLVDQFEFFAPSSRVSIFPAYDVLPYYGLSPHRGVGTTQLAVLSKLLADEMDILVTTPQAIARRLMPSACFREMSLTLVKNDLLDRDLFINRLVLMGYERSSVCEDPGQFAVRGDTIDVFSPQYEKPLRLSFFDIELEELKTYDPISQRTSDTLTQAVIIPTREIFLAASLAYADDTARDDGLLKKVSEYLNPQWKTDLKRKSDARDIAKEKRDQIEEFIKNRIYFHGIEFFYPLFYKKTGSLFDYLARQAILVTDLSATLDKVIFHHTDHVATHHEDSDHIESIFTPTDLFLTPTEVSQILNERTVLLNEVNLSEIDSLPQIEGRTESNLLLKTKITAQITQVHTLAPLASELNQKRLDGYECFIVSTNDVQQMRVKDLLTRFDLPLREIAAESKNDVIAATLKTGSDQRLVTLLTGVIHEGFIAHDSHQWWITDEEIFGKKTRRVPSAKSKTAVFSSFSELTEGDYIIHLDHGVGIYRGLVKLSYDVHQNDFLLLEYLGGDKLYVPIDKLNRVQRFAGEEGVVPSLDKMGGKSWEATRTKAKRAAKRLAKELLELQAMRESQSREAFGAHTEATEEFAAAFEFEETPDQMRAIEDVTRDMEAKGPMDRLVCGDVGYGKTEVAMRAAYKAVCDGRQVAVLVPTTVLAFQHFTTFKKRLEKYPVTVELLSRFRTAKDEKEVLNDLKQGKVDIVVGTHRLLSQDVKLSNLGLLVIDEEHRFGVIHKEKIKKLKHMVDVVTLTATPIPRTLNFALNGIRSLSVIDTPPVDRLAIKTYTCGFDEITIRDVILKELRRGGQIYFVHNRVQSIEKITAQIKKLVPEARVVFGHGQMEENNLEKVMIDFMNHDFDVLVCTTIIESGLDIPNANTIIINRADGFGLAQLYQLRGRVGRGAHQAYCYLIVPDDSLVSNTARKRLSAIQKFTELGSGFKIATRDLEIRGAGNILGDEQSGHVAAIGYDLYIHMLKQAIDELRSLTPVPEDFEPEISLNLPAKIPETFIPDQQLRLVMYKQMSSATSNDDIEDIKEEWQDRFGVMPLEVQNLFGLIAVKILCRQFLVSGVKQGPDGMVLSFHPDHKIDTSKLARLVKQQPKIYAITRDGRLSITKKVMTTEQILAELKILR